MRARLVIGIGCVRHVELRIIKALPVAVVVLVERVQAHIARARYLLRSRRLQVVDAQGAAAEGTV